MDGRVVFGPDPRGLILTVIAVLLSEWIFLADIVDPSSNHPVQIAAFSIVLAATVSDTHLSRNVLDSLILEFGSFVILANLLTGDGYSATDCNKRPWNRTKKPDLTATRSWHEHDQKNQEPAHHCRRRREEAEVLQRLRHLPCSEELTLCNLRQLRRQV